MRYARFDELLVEGPKYEPRQRQVTIGWNDARRLKKLDTTRVLTLKVRFSREGEPMSVNLESAERLTPRQLARFPWAKWLSAARATFDLRGYPGADVIWDAMIPTSREPKRPGRKGHSKTFYKRVAAKHRKLTTGGVTNPAVVIAREIDDVLGTPVSADTVRGWIKKCRAMDPPLIPPVSR